MSTAATADGAREIGPKVPELLLASSSPRRRMLLERAGLPHLAVSPAFDDSNVAEDIGRGIAERTVALAWLKASATVDALRGRGRAAGMVIAADTLVSDRDRALGKPRSAGEAEAMLRSLAGRTHLVWTGHAVVDLASGGRRLWAASAEVRFGPIDETRLERHLGGGAWMGRAGGYSLDELDAEGWPVECVGDPEVVLGLSTAGVRRAIAMLASGLRTSNGADRT